MKYILEEYGAGLLSGAAAVLLITLFLSVLQPGGTLNQTVEAFFAGMAG